MNREVGEVLSGARQWCVIQGDCMDVLRQFEDGCVGAAINDPPYPSHVHRNLRRVNADRSNVNEIVASTFAPITDYSFVREQLRVTKRWVLNFCAVEDLGTYKAQAPECHVRSGIYRKQRAAPQISGDRPANACEGIAMFHRPGKKRWNGGGHHAFYEAMPEDRSRDDDANETAKPLALMLQLVGLFTQEDEVIMDSFVGSGTTGVAAIRMGRRFIGIDIRESQVKRSRERLIAEESGSSLVAARAGQIALFGTGGK